MAASVSYISSILNPSDNSNVIIILYGYLNGYTNAKSQEFEVRHICINLQTILA